MRIENFVASLPFSKLRVTNGFVYFSNDNPFIPQLNIQAQSTLQDYNINVFIYGPADDPKTVMSSEPPLPQEDIVALLATGATSQNLSNGNALAGRAAYLVLQQLYHKIVKSKGPPADGQRVVCEPVQGGRRRGRPAHRAAGDQLQLQADAGVLPDRRPRRGRRHSRNGPLSPTL